MNLVFMNLNAEPGRYALILMQTLPNARISMMRPKCFATHVSGMTVLKKSNKTALYQAIYSPAQVFLHKENPLLHRAFHGMQFR